jgi:hypothetical protein
LILEIDQRLEDFYEGISHGWLDMKRETFTWLDGQNVSNLWHQTFFYDVRTHISIFTSWMPVRCYGPW